MRSNSHPSPHHHRLAENQGGISVGLLLGIVNTLLVLVALGVLVYTRVLFKRPPITEEGERQRISQRKTQVQSPFKPGILQLEPVTVNIRAFPTGPLPAEGKTSQMQGKIHFVKANIALELRNIDEKAKVDDVRAVIMDKLLTLIGNKSFDEVTTVQGRYILRNDIMEMINKVIKEPLIINVFFSEFVVQ